VKILGNLANISIHCAKINWLGWASVALGLVAMIGVFGQGSWSNNEFIYFLMILGFAGIVLGYLGRSYNI